MTSEGKSLVERARLTQKDIRNLIPWELGEFPYAPAPSVHHVSEAQLAKALWAVVEWLKWYDACTQETPEEACAVFLLRKELTAAGIERPKEVTGP